MFDAQTELLNSGKTVRYSISRDGQALSFQDVIHLWQADLEFLSYFRLILTEAPFSGFRWETPALTTESAEKPFEFVLIDSPGFCSRATDSETYASYFSDDDPNEGIVSFPNIRGDAVLVVPSPRTEVDAYGHLAAFVRNGPELQVNSLWRMVATTVESRISEIPLWLSTAGGGVAWLHVRLDSYPKYYGFSAYKLV